MAAYVIILSFLAVMGAILWCGFRGKRTRRLHAALTLLFPGNCGSNHRRAVCRPNSASARRRRANDFREHRESPRSRHIIAVTPKRGAEGHGSGLGVYRQVIEQKGEIRETFLSIGRSLICIGRLSSVC